MVDRSHSPSSDETAVQAVFPRVLLVAHNDVDAARIEALLGEVPEHEVDLARAENLVEAIALLGNNRFDCVLLALGHDMDSILNRTVELSQHTLDLPIVIATTPQREESARAATFAGAQGYFLIGSMNGAKLVWTIQNAVVGHELSEITRDVRHQRREVTSRMPLCERCVEVRSHAHEGAELDAYVLPWSTHSTHHVVCRECAQSMGRRSA